MKVLMVSDSGSIHTRRWASALKEAGVDIVLYSITPESEEFYREKNIKLYIFDLFRYKKEKNLSFVSRFRAHFRAAADLKKVISAERPDILHAHYATSYGLVAALAGFHPLIVSVWGSDIYEFPRQSVIKRLMTRYVLRKADRVLSTSAAMARETARYYRGQAGITPFGVDTSLFAPGTGGRPGGTVVFGTVKTLSHKYGIDLLLKAFARMREMMRRSLPDGKVPATRLEIAGKGPDTGSLKALAGELGIASDVVFLGEIAHDDVPGFYAGTDVAVFLSRAESFGVSAVEAMSCGVPVVASAADGFREVLEDGGGIIVPVEDADAAAEAMMKMAMDPALRSSSGKAGREKACRCYEWRKNVASMTGEYEAVLASARS
ncbi:MAG: glycosyltransferase [Bacteroidetes bacterium]|uniref:Glycosyltransferase n=1 Tax=Candidatus Cryptobacteroides merdigallinarum TaxID=2840770 RepID=A0A9D9EJ94_9BACT|nr:glycosyltransferase [Candidatus Cryptobacteroides merdigallinarum]